MWINYRLVFDITNDITKKRQVIQRMSRKSVKGSIQAINTKKSRLSGVYYFVPRNSNLE